MNIQQQTAEYTRQGLVKRIDIVSNSPTCSQIRITTLQDQVLSLEVSVRGIKHVETGKVFQTFQSLLRQNSKMYTQRFFQLLNQKLLGLKAGESN